jgi:hypothetical protein
MVEHDLQVAFGPVELEHVAQLNHLPKSFARSICRVQVQQM